MSEEIRRLSVLVDDFNDPFHPDPLVVNVYKSRLNHHIENGIGSNLKSRLSTDLQLNVESHEQVNVTRMNNIVVIGTRKMEYIEQASSRYFAHFKTNTKSMLYPLKQWTYCGSYKMG